MSGISCSEDALWEEGVFKVNHLRSKKSADHQRFFLGLFDLGAKLLSSFNENAPMTD